MKKAFLLALALSGCNSGPYNYYGGCLEFDSEVPLYMNKVDMYAAKAQEIYEQKFGKNSFCKNLKNTHIRVLDKAFWECPLGLGGCIGLADAFGNVELGRHGTALLHELLHVHERSRGIIAGSGHPDWEQKGFFAMDNEFSQHVTSEGTWITP